MIVAEIFEHHHIEHDVQQPEVDEDRREEPPNLPGADFDESRQPANERPPSVRNRR